MEESGESTKNRFSSITGEELKEIQELYRRGVSLAEKWSFILNSPRHQEWKAQSPQGKITLAMWAFLLERERREYLEKWERENGEEKGNEVQWWEVVFDGPWKLYNDALVMLKEVDPEAEETVTALIQALDNPNMNVRQKATFALGRLGNKARKAVPLLIQCRKDPNEPVTQGAKIALRKIGAALPEAFPTLMALLQDKHPCVRLNAASALGKLGRASKKAVPQLHRALLDEYPEVTHEAIQALCLISQETPVATPHLIQALRHKDVVVRYRAAEGLGSILPTTFQIISALRHTLRDPQKSVGKMAAMSLKRIAPH
jgi:hypothetical protein